jgi:hypothetical protein
VLDDPAGFFGEYEAAIVVSARALDRHPGLDETLRRLRGRIDTAAMQRMNALVQLEGRSPERVAADFLRYAGIVEEAVAVRPGRAELLLVHDRNDRLGVQAARAFGMVRGVFPDYAVLQQAVDDPIEWLVEGEARLAVLGAERMFETTVEGSPARRDRVEAVSVAGNRTIHVLVRRDRRPDTNPLDGRIGIVPAGSGAARVSEDVLAIGETTPALRAAPRTLIDQLLTGDLDAAILVLESPDSEIAEALAENEALELVSLPREWLGAVSATLMPYLEAARIPPDTYVGQTEAIESASVQVVIAEAAPMEGERTHIGGLVSAVRASGVPLTPEEQLALLDAGLAGEMPNPALPSPWSLRPRPTRFGASEAGEVVDTVLNIAAWAFIVLLLVLLFRSTTRSRTR